LYLDPLRRFHQLYDAPLPYGSARHQAPLRVGRDLMGLHLEVFPIRRAPGTRKFRAGSESGTGGFLGAVRPETAAPLRAAV
jgi:UDPglucose--hexose-1-phosphate uridylyltransferase